MKLKLEWHIPASIAITLLHLIAHNAAQAQTTQPAASPATVPVVIRTAQTLGNTANDAITAQAADAARRDTDPKLNGSVSDVPSRASGQ